MSAPTPTSAPPVTAGELTDAPVSPSATTEHLDWASRVKEQHRHLQAAVASSGARTDHNENHMRSTSTPASVYEAELAVWRGALRGEAAAERLSAYATAMHHLATRYWDPGTATTESGARADGGVASSGAAGDGGVVDPTTAALGIKRQRDNTAPREGVLGSRSAVIGSAGAATTSGIDNPRHYSDRLGYCLQSTAAYFLGELEPHSTAVVTAGPATESGAAATARRGALPLQPAVPATTTTTSAATLAASSQPSTVEVHGAHFRQLPGVFARAVKPLRRLFFQRHQRVATEGEVTQLIAACTPPATAALLRRGASARGPPDAAAVAELLTNAGSAAAVLAESAWRRGVDSAWATALRYTSEVLVAAETPAVPPLHVLDVGSCYGPFAHRQLRRGAARPAVPLHVISMDLAPYEDGEVQTRAVDAVRKSTPAPRVWQADWLQMQFFTETDAVCTAPAHGTAVVGEAEDGRVRYGYRASSSVSADRVVPPADTGAGSCEGRRHGPPAAIAVRLESFDAVFFCLLLSYVPTPRLRFLACVHAVLALREGGLLVVVSTRTQGPRRRNWMDEWAACVAHIGLQRVQQSIQEKIVGMSFAKMTPSAAVREGWATAEGRAAWVRQQMESATAAAGLRIIADDAKDRCDV